MTTFIDDPLTQWSQTRCLQAECGPQVVSVHQIYGRCELYFYYRLVLSSSLKYHHLKPLLLKYENVSPYLAKCDV